MEVLSEGISIAPSNANPSEGNPAGFCLLRALSEVEFAIAAKLLAAIFPRRNCVSLDELRDGP